MELTTTSVGILGARRSGDERIHEVVAPLDEADVCATDNSGASSWSAAANSWGQCERKGLGSDWEYILAKSTILGVVRLFEPPHSRALVSIPEACSLLTSPEVRAG
jgi:hypothetical protein